MVCSNPGWQDGRRRWMDWAIAAPFNDIRAPLNIILNVCLFFRCTWPQHQNGYWHSWRMGLSSHQGLIVFPIYVSERLTIKKVRGGGQVLTVVVFCSDYLSSNPNWVYNFSVDLWFKITKNKQKVGRDWPVFLTKGRRLALSHLKSLQKSGEESLT